MLHGRLLTLDEDLGLDTLGAERLHEVPLGVPVHLQNAQILQLLRELLPLGIGEGRRGRHVEPLPRFDHLVDLLELAADEVGNTLVAYVPDLVENLGLESLPSLVLHLRGDVHVAVSFEELSPPLGELGSLLSTLPMRVPR